jgi:hypothetical protein
MTDREQFLKHVILKALKVKGNPVRTTEILMEGIQNIASPPPPALYSGKQGLDEAFGAAPRKEPEEKPKAKLSDWLKDNPGKSPVGLNVRSMLQPGAVYSIAAESELKLAGARMFDLTVVKSKKGGEGHVFHNVPENYLELA